MPAAIAAQRSASRRTAAGPLRRIYHGWTYRTNGELSSIPPREGFGSGFDPAEYGLIPLPRVDSYRGFIFASLSHDGMSLGEHLGRGARGGAAPAPAVASGGSPAGSTAA